MFYKTEVKNILVEDNIVQGNSFAGNGGMLLSEGTFNVTDCEIQGNIVECGNNNGKAGGIGISKSHSILNFR